MNQPHNVNISLEQTSPIACEFCDWLYMHEALHIRKVSGILTGTGQPSYIPIPVFACDRCKHVNKEFLPRELVTSKLQEDES